MTNDGLLRVGVTGALGRMGRLAADVLSSQADIQYVGGFARTADAQRHIVNNLEELFTHAPDVLVDFTTHPSTVEIAMQALAHGVRPVIGATGWTNDEREVLARMAQERGIGAMLVPNFSIGAVLMIRFAQEAARFFPTAEIVEMHHDRKKDKPSGTARLTAERMVAHSDLAQVPIHSIRLRGLVAHQEVLLSGEGELLTIRHDSLSRESFAAGIIAATKAVMHVQGLVIGLDSILGGA